MSVCGIVLAAGGGTRFGGPKALARTDTGRPWLEIAVTTLRRAGCDTVLVAVGARAEEATRLVPGGAVAVPVPDWAHGLAAPLRAVLGAAAATTASAALVIPVDMPDLPVTVCARVLAEGAGPASLVRAVYRGRPGHPVLLGRSHWDAVGATARGDRGAGPYLAEHAATPIECADLFSGADIDTPASARVSPVVPSPPREPATGDPRRE